MTTPNQPADPSRVTREDILAVVSLIERLKVTRDAATNAADKKHIQDNIIEATKLKLAFVRRMQAQHRRES